MRTAVVLMLMLALTNACGEMTTPGTGVDSLMVVANRGDGTISIISALSMSVIDTIALPAASNPAVPGYVTYSDVRRRLYVGDEANSRIVVYDADDFSHVTDLPVLEDVFHIWHNDAQLWAVDRTNKSVAVFDLDTNTRITNIPIPVDLEAAGGEPHDVVVDANHAFVSVLGVDMAPDVVVRYSTTTLTSTGRVPVGEDPHLFLHPTTPRLYVACQDSDAVWVFDRETLVEEDVISVDGGHGVWIPPHGRRLYVTNFAGHEPAGPNPLGPFALLTIDLATNTVVDGEHAQHTAPHNIASNESGTRIFVTHSNGGNAVTVYWDPNEASLPAEIATLEVGANPFGICRIR